ncbi:MAG: hypothetical protein EZS28_040962 [Streblomastix strix]|uniref:Cyclin N-terminal domain-containing protein n=1 Tax=Streblomastix strix TaxID=222440 RepID=A0A5J4U0L0_9EUKA|nr:MAG: hypothetical protein EZS28_040962 [Streblomastix strix]
MVINESNLGTVLICAVILALKNLRDAIEYRNCWWAKAFGMSLELLNLSEIAFCTKLGFKVAVDLQQFFQLYQQNYQFLDIGRASQLHQRAQQSSIFVLQRRFEIVVYQKEFSDTVIHVDT